MIQRILEFYQDDQTDWVAFLECGHSQHFRHNPPFLLRPWTLTPEGRQAYIGMELNCLKCDFPVASGAEPEPVI